MASFSGDVDSHSGKINEEKVHVNSSGSSESSDEDIYEVEQIIGMSTQKVRLVHKARCTPCMTPSQSRPIAVC